MIKQIGESSKNLRENIQAVIVFGLHHYTSKNEDGQTNGDSSTLTSLVKSIDTHKTISTKKVVDYIKAHSNLTFDRDKKVFKKASKKEQATSIKLSRTWWNYAMPEKEPKPLMIAARLKSLDTTITTALNDGVKLSTVDLSSMLAKLNRTIKMVEQAEVAEKRAEARAFLEANPEPVAVAATK